MLKKILLISSVLAMTSTVALADFAPAPYVGGGIGLTNSTVDLKSGSAKSATFGSYRGVPFNVFAGYGGIVNQNLYLAGEVNGTIATANISNNDNLKTSHSLGASIIPGVVLGDHSLLYGRAGVVRSRFSEVSDTRNGGQFGVGLQTSLTQNVDIRGEYDFVAYKSVSTHINGIRTTAAPRSDQFTMGLVYKFD